MLTLNSQITAVSELQPINNYPIPNMNLPDENLLQKIWSLMGHYINLNIVVQILSILIILAILQIVSYLLLRKLLEKENFLISAIYFIRSAILAIFTSNIIFFSRNSGFYTFKIISDEYANLIIKNNLSLFATFLTPVIIFIIIEGLRQILLKTVRKDSNKYKKILLYIYDSIMNLLLVIFLVITVSPFITNVINSINSMFRQGSIN